MQNNTVAAVFGKIATSFVAISMIIFGVQHIFYADFVTRLVPKNPWTHEHPFFAYAFGAFLIAAGAAILLGKLARPVALLLGAVIFISFAALQLPLAIAALKNGGLWTNAGKAIALSGSAFLVAGSLRKEMGSSPGWFATTTEPLEKFIPLGRFFIGAFLVLCGIEHFIYVDFVTPMVPAWIPGHLFWTYFSAVALIAGGVGMNIRPTAEWAAMLSSLMIFLWVLLLHIPRAMADLHNANETTAVFEALALSGAIFLVTINLPKDLPRDAQFVALSKEPHENPA